MAEPTVACLLDASALLAVLQQEPGAERIAPRLGQAAISTVNLAEVVAVLTDRGVPDEAIDALLTALDPTVLAFERPQAVMAGRLRRTTRTQGLSLGDRACLAEALARGVPALTTDRAWADLAVEALQVEVVR